ncbi:MAG: stage IV sporulation protein A, partial [Clostridia bacterium]
KSTFIKRFMEVLVLDNIEDKNKRQRALDELPQSADGKSIMTTQPKFVPDTSAKIKLGDNLAANIRLIDCVGYPIAKAEGFADGDKSRLVRTPWSDEEMSFREAAELGTSKVINDHSTIGIVMTTDGTITDFQRGDYVETEMRVIDEMKALNKPFVIVLNTRKPNDTATKKLQEDMSAQYQIPVVVQNVAEMTVDDIANILGEVLMQFPLKKMEIAMPSWLQAMPKENEIITHILDKVSQFASELTRMQDYDKVEGLFDEDEFVDRSTDYQVDFGKGAITLNLQPKSELFYKILSVQSGEEIASDFELVSYIKSLSVAKKHYDKLKYALEEVDEFGYGVVTPTREDISFDPPKIVKKGAKYGVRLHASAPSYHIMKVDVDTEVSPLLGGESNNEEILQSWLGEFGENAIGLWDTNMLGKTLADIAKEGLGTKLMTMQEDTRNKLRKTVYRIVNEGKGGVLCILL